MINDMCAAEVRVLYVDDEASLCRAFARMFGADDDFRVDTTTSSLEAVNLIEEHAFDVIVSDLRMPGMDGIELLTAARHKRPHARRLLVSGFADLDTALSAINKVGVDRLLTKPCDSLELVQAVRTAGDNARLARENAVITEELRQKAEELAAMNRALDRLVEERSSRRSICATRRRSGTRAGWAATRAASPRRSGSRAATSTTSSGVPCSTTSARSACATPSCSNRGPSRRASGRR
jgi:response regulator RpfG family c-di-GMP phosphodiesterase